MAMNREQKRMLQRQGQLGADGDARGPQRTAPRPSPSATDERTTPAQFVREVRGELRKVAWPTRAEVDQLLDHRARHRGRPDHATSPPSTTCSAKSVLKLFND